MKPSVGFWGFRTLGFVIFCISPLVMLILLLYNGQNYVLRNGGNMKAKPAVEIIWTVKFRLKGKPLHIKKSNETKTKNNKKVA